MEDKLLRQRLNNIRDAMRIITEEINSIYNDNSESKNVTISQDDLCDVCDHPRLNHIKKGCHVMDIFDKRCKCSGFTI